MLNVIKTCVSFNDSYQQQTRIAQEWLRAFRLSIYSLNL